MYVNFTTDQIIGKLLNGETAVSILRELTRGGQTYTYSTKAICRALNLLDPSTKKARSFCWETGGNFDVISENNFR